MARIVTNPEDKNVEELYDRCKLIVWDNIVLSTMTALQSLPMHNVSKWKKLKSRDVLCKIKDIDAHPIKVWTRDYDIAVKIQNALRLTEREMYHHVHRWFPNTNIGPELHSWRYSITMNEPLHFDVYADRVQQKVIRIFVNLDTEPRVWALGPRHKEGDGSYYDPIYKAQVIIAPTQTVEFPPGTIWAIDSRKVAHAILYGRRAAMFSYQVN